MFKFIIQNSRKVFLSLIILGSMAGVFINIINSSVPENYTYFAPELAYISNPNISNPNISIIERLESDKISYEKTVPLEQTKKSSSINGIDLQQTSDLTKLKLSGSTSVSYANQINQKLLYADNYVDYSLATNLNSSYVNESKIDIPLFASNINQVLVGQMPIASDEILIGETLANELIAKNNYNTYEQLLNMQIKVKEQSFKVVGVYEAITVGEIEYLFTAKEYLTSEELFMYESTYDDIIIEFEDEKQKQDFLSNYQGLEVIDQELYPNMKTKVLIIKIVIIIILNVLFMFQMKKETKFFLQVCSNHRIGRLTKFINIAVCYIVVTVIVTLILM